MFSARARSCLVLVLTVGLLLSLWLPVQAASNSSIRITIDGQPVMIPSGDQLPFVLQGRTYVPLRVISQRLGSKVDWRKQTRQVVIVTAQGDPAAPVPERVGAAQDIQIIIDGRVLVIPPGYGRAMVTRAGRTVIPLRVVGEALGCQVNWDRVTRVVEIHSQSLNPAPDDGNGGTQPAGTDEMHRVKLLKDLAGYRTNLKLLDGTVINSQELLNRDALSFSEQQIQKFEEYRQALAQYESQVRLPGGSVIDVASLEIRGPAIASADQLKAWMTAETPRIKAKMEQVRQRPFMPIPLELVDTYLRIGAEYGIRGDLAFCQAVKETEYFQFTGSVQPWQNNYCGLWATGSPCTGQESLNGADPSLVSFQAGVHGAVFPTPEAGVEAHIQHLYAYACKDPLPAGKVLCDPRFNLVSRGCAPTWQGLNARWAVPGVTYGQSIILDYWKKALASS